MSGRPISNKCDYFKHDNNLRNHKKVKALKNKFGPSNGYAFFTVMLEYLTGSDSQEFELTEFEIEMFAAEVGLESQMVREMINFSCDIDLLQKDDQNFLRSDSLNERLASVYIKREKDRTESRAKKKKSNLIIAARIQLPEKNGGKTGEIFKKSHLENGTEKKVIHNTRSDNSIIGKDNSITGNNNLNNRNDKSITDIENTHSTVQYSTAQEKERNKKEKINTSLSPSMDKNPYQKKYTAFKKWIEENAASLLQLPEQITIDEYAQLLKRFPEEKSAYLQKKLKAMHNTKNLQQKYRNVYTTLLSWIDMDEQTINNKFHKR